MLTATGVKNLKAREKRYEVFDGGNRNGLSVEVMPSGSKFWRGRFRIDGKVYRRSLGEFPAVGLKEAREICADLRGKILRRENPFLKREKRMSFQALAEEWLDVKVFPVRTPNHSRTVVSRLENYVFPYIGTKEAAAVLPGEILEFLRKIESRGTFETAHRVKQVCGQVFRYGVATGRVERDVTADLKGALSEVPEKHYPTITAPEEIGGLMRAIDGLNGSLGVRLALKLQAYTFVRPGELRKAEWKEIDLEKAEWRIPPARMKMNRLHIVPLSTQALDVLRELRLFTGEMKYLFPTFRSPERPMSDATVNAALRRLSYHKSVFTGHSFRSMASTILNEHQFNRDWIERQLAHVEGNSVRAAYNYADYLPERRKMMQWWADWLDAQAKGPVKFPEPGS